MSAGFEWGVTHQTELSNEVATITLNEGITIPSRSSLNIKAMHNNHNLINSQSLGRKRKHFEDDMRVHKPSNMSSRKIQSPISGRTKKSKTPKILGQPLPLNRLVEVLDHKSLQNLLHNLIQIHPEVSGTVDKLCPKPTMSSSLALLKEKFDNIISHLPYKCDIESDYSYLRVKGYLNEFLNYLSDFILNYLPPNETNIVKSLTFMDLVTGMIHKLPNFSNTEFQYTKSMAYDQLSNTWLIALSQNKQCLDDQSVGENGSETDISTSLVKILNELEIEEKLHKHNDLSMGRFNVALDFVKSEMENFEVLNRTLINNGQSLINDLITIDYSKFSIAAKTSH
ncbi:uncharacterized protein PRCAT00002582001 [Priceomyces carsonii]|uniref:uncharacterized protein n=1 Tax=Priceomyces carsonii TaxID=28549 RepID=UPI002ED85689|nr:unnamed protein product [Priceomyces carsonii]